MKQVDQDLLRAALTGYEFELQNVEAKISELRRQMNGRGRVTLTSDDGVAPVRKRKPFSAATRRKMAAAQRRRWNALKAAKDGK
jgi:hypothetical protein